jgi:hypothetical protein
MSDGNSMNELKSFVCYEDLAHYVSNTKPNMGRLNRGRIPLGERRYTSLFWCRTHGSSGCIEMFCESSEPVLRWHEDNSIEILSGNSYYNWRFAEFLSRTIHGAHFFTYHGKIYWGEYIYRKGEDRWFLPHRNLDNKLNKSYRIIKKDERYEWVPESPIQEYKYVMNKKRMAEIRAMFKPFYQYMQAVLAVDPEFGRSYENVKYYDVEEFENLLRNPTDDPSIMKEMLVKCTTQASRQHLSAEWKKTVQLTSCRTITSSPSFVNYRVKHILGGYHTYKSTCIGFKQAKEQFESILKIFYFNEVFEYAPVEIGKKVHDLNAKYGNSKWAK